MLKKIFFNPSMRMSILNKDCKTILRNIVMFLGWNNREFLFHEFFCIFQVSLKKKIIINIRHHTQ